MSRARTRYSLGEIRRLVEDYPALLERVDTRPRGLHYLVSLLDIRRCVRRLPDGLRKVVLLHGVWGASTVQTAEWLGITEDAARYRYDIGLRLMQRYLNGGSN